MHKRAERFLRSALLAGMTFGAVHSGRAAVSSDQDTLLRLNAAYLEAYLHSDVAVYRELLADDFVAVLADGRLLDKAHYLAMAAVPAQVRDFHLVNIAIRQFGDTAVVVGRVSYTAAGGARIGRRYLTVYLRRNGGWQAISDQLTPIAPP